MSKHTQLPYAVGDRNGHCGISILADGDLQIATVYLDKISSEWTWAESIDRPENAKSKATAEFIVRACNSHYALLEACRAAEMFIRNGVALGYIQMPDKDVPDPAHKTPGMLRDAIAKAEGG